MSDCYSVASLAVYPIGRFFTKVENMKIQNLFSLGGFTMTLVIVASVSGRAIPDFYTDEDLSAWHKFGLRSFYGPWSVIAKKPNGDFISYTDYGSTVPSDFRPISTDGIDDYSTTRNNNFDYGTKYPSGFSEIAAGYEMNPIDLASFANGIHNLDESSFHRSSIKNTRSEHPEDTSSLKNNGVNDKPNEPDTLELIGIVGVVGETDDSFDEGDTTTTGDTINDDEEKNDRTTVADISINFTS